PEARVGGLRTKVREERDPTAVDPRPEQLEHGREDGHRGDDRAADDEDRPARNPVEHGEIHHVHPGHRNRDSRAGDEDRATGRPRSALDRLVCRETAVSLLSRADDVEERVVDAYGHPDEEDDGLDAVVEWEHLAYRAEQSERCGDGGERDQERDERRDDRTEREEEDEERYRDREKLGAMEVAMDGTVAGVARG